MRDSFSSLCSAAKGGCVAKTAACCRSVKKKHFRSPWVRSFRFAAVALLHHPSDMQFIAAAIIVAIIILLAIILPIVFSVGGSSYDTSPAVSNQSRKGETGEPQDRTQMPMPYEPVRLFHLCERLT